MGWKGTVRSLAAAARAAEREHQRHQRALDKQRFADESARFVGAHEGIIERLTTLHRQVSGSVLDWEAIAASGGPPAPVRLSTHEDKALDRLLGYKPGLWHRIAGKEAATRTALQLKVAEGRERDSEIYESELSDHAALAEEAEREADLARRVLAGDTDAFEEVLMNYASFDSLEFIGSGISFDLRREDGATGADVSVHAKVSVHSSEIIPAEQHRLLKSGGVSTRPMPKTRFHAIHQDYVCGAALAVASEVLALFPVGGVIVTAVDDMLNTATGHVEETAILSIYAPRATMERLNLYAADASDAMENFLCRMSFLKTKGFKPVEPLGFEDLPRA